MRIKQKQALFVYACYGYGYIRHSSCIWAALEEPRLQRGAKNTPLKHSKTTKKAIKRYINEN